MSELRSIGISGHRRDRSYAIKHRTVHRKSTTNLRQLTEINKREEVVIDTEEENDDEEVNYMALPEKETEKRNPPSARISA